MILSGKIIQLHILDTTAAVSRKPKRRHGPVVTIALVLIVAALLVFARGMAGAP